LFLSNNPTHNRYSYAARLTRLGLPTTPEEVINSSLVMVQFLQREMAGARLLVVGEASLYRELADAGFQLTYDPPAAQAVIASFDRTFAYWKLQAAFDALRHGARFFATNSDRYCPTPSGGQPDAAAIIAAIEACTNRTVEVVVGKPSHHMAEAALRQLRLAPGDCLMIGDRLETDVRLGLEAGMATALALTGATSRAAAAESEIRPNYILNALAELWPAGL
jgi:NagD protein